MFGGQIHHNAIPTGQPQPPNQARSYQQTEAGAVNRSSNEYAPIVLGNTF